MCTPFPYLSNASTSTSKKNGQKRLRLNTKSSRPHPTPPQKEKCKHAMQSGAAPFGGGTPTTLPCKTQVYFFGEGARRTGQRPRAHGLPTAFAARVTDRFCRTRGSQTASTRVTGRFCRTGYRPRARGLRTAVAQVADHERAHVLQTAVALAVCNPCDEKAVGSPWCAPAEKKDKLSLACRGML